MRLPCPCHQRKGLYKTVSANTKVFDTVIFQIHIMMLGRRPRMLIAHVQLRVH